MNRYVKRVICVLLVVVMNIELCAAALASNIAEESNIYVQSINGSGKTIKEYEIIDTNGNKHHIKDFSEDYIAVVFGRAGCGMTMSTINTLLQYQKTGVSVKILFLAVDDNLGRMDSFLSEHLEDDLIVSKEYEKNNSIGWFALREATGTTESFLSFSFTFIFDKNRELILARHSYSGSDLGDLFIERLPYKTGIILRGVDGRDYELAEFMENYVVLFFSGTAMQDGPSESMCKAATDIVEAGKSVKVIFLELYKTNSVKKYSDRFPRISFFFRSGA